MNANPEKKTSPWAWFIGGCLTLLVLIAIGIGGCVFVVTRWASNLSAEMKDPAKRVSNAEEILGVSALPEGYNAVAAFSVPYLLDVAVLSDAPPSATSDEPDLGSRGLIYVRLIRLGKNKQQLEDYFAGRTNDPDVLKKNGINLGVREVLRRGAIEGTPRLLYLVQRGEISVKDANSRESLVTLVLPECTGSGKFRLAAWYGPDVPAATPEDTSALAGTHGDEEQIRTFMGQFKLCE